MPRCSCPFLLHCSCNALPDVLCFLWHASLLYLLTVPFFAHPEHNFLLQCVCPCVAIHLPSCRALRIVSPPVPVLMHPRPHNDITKTCDACPWGTPASRCVCSSNPPLSAELQFFAAFCRVTVRKSTLVALWVCNATWAASHLAGVFVVLLKVGLQGGQRGTPAAHRRAAATPTAAAAAGQGGIQELDLRVGTGRNTRGSQCMAACARLAPRTGSWGRSSSAPLESTQSS